MLIIAKRTWGIKDILKSFESKGRKKGKPRGSHIDDFVALRKSIALCGTCRKGFNPKGKQYTTSRKVPICRGACDSCREWNEVNYLFMPIEFGHVVGASPE